MENICHAKVNMSGAAILIADKIDFSTRSIASSKEWYFIIRKRSMNQENTAIICEYVLNNRASKYMKDWKEKHKYKITVLDFKTTLNNCINI